MPQSITRFAPSPTGALHLGNARTFLANWLLARQNNWKIILRIEDIDGPRIRKDADQQAIDDLRWLGLDWDEGPIYQSARLPLYADAIARLVATKGAYPCICTRREIDLAASAPHPMDGSTIYPGTCRDRFTSIDEATRFAGRPPAIRFRMPDQTIAFTDAFADPQTWSVARDLGDFVIAKNDGTPAYHLAVVVDDAAMNVTHIVRGDDLLDSTPRQILLYRALDLTDHIPTYYHLPLITGPDGRRLAKRHGDTRLSSYRDAGIPAGRILSLLASWCGIDVNDDSLRPSDLIGQFSLGSVPRHSIVFEPMHLQFDD